MARLEAQSKLMYYPTPSSVVVLIASHFISDEFPRLVDPCCGEGDALNKFASMLKDREGYYLDDRRETWGIELSYSRAESAACVLTTVLATSFYEMRPPGRWSNASVSLAFNNPPYDWSDFVETRGPVNRHVRHEVLFIEGVTPKIIVGGHQVIIVPYSILGDKNLLGEGQESRLARHLNGWYESLNIQRFPDDDYERFNQVVVFACNKRKEYHHSTDEELEYILSAAQSQTVLPPLVEGHGEYVIPPAPASKVIFVHTPVGPEQLLALGQKCSPIPTPAYQHATYVRPIGAAFMPAMPLSIGHITMLIAGQETGVLKLPEGDRSMLVKGMSRKVVEVAAQDNANDEGVYTSTKVTEREKHVATITIAHEDGELEVLQSSHDVGDFVTEFADPIAEAILERNQPLYNLLPTDPEWNNTQNSAVGLPPLPGREKRGLFDVQRHFAIAAARVMKKHKHCIMNAEMGFGKTSTAIAAIELLNQFPVVVMCPDHMVWKWKRDLEAASNPEDRITARVITRPVLDDLPRWVSSIRSAIVATGAVVLETHRFQIDPTTPKDPGVRRRMLIDFSQADLVALNNVIGSFSFRSNGSKSIPPSVHYDKEGMVVELVDRDEYTMFDFHTDYITGLLGRKAVAIIAFDPAKYDAGADEMPAHFMKHRRMRNESTGESRVLKVPACPNCGELLKPIEDYRFCPSCHALLFNFNRWRRVGLARLVQRKFRGFFKVYISDEVHKCQNGRTDIGTADQRFISATKYSLALTGTLFGGTAGSLFYLLYRRVTELRKLYDFDEMTRFIDHYGVWERTWTQGKPYYEGDTGKSTGIKRWNYRQRELPGVAPAVIRFLLPITLFGNITDLGYELPSLYENVEELPMTDDLFDQYEFLEKELLKDALEIGRNGDAGALSTWFCSCRFRPASAFRSEEINYVSKKGKGEIHIKLAAVSDAWLPKEIKLADIVRANMAKGRKTLTFVEQTGTRDIRDRLKQVIETLVPGGSMSLVEVPKVGILSAGDMSPSRRESWIKLSAPKMHTMLVNPKLVETGLDLVMFSDLVFYEVTTSLYTLWQSMRRVWRLGQKKDVNVTFLSYVGTIESEILRRMGLKMKYAQLLYGKEAAGILVESDGEDDIQRQIISAALEGKAFRNAGEAVENLTIFSTGMERTIQVTTSPVGSVVAVSPVILPVYDLPSGQVCQLTLFPGFEPVPIIKRKRK